VCLEKVKASHTKLTGAVLETGEYRMSCSNTVELNFRPWVVPDQKRRCLWIDDALSAENDRKVTELAGTQIFDVCIVGGGFTGLWTALHLREHDAGLRIAILEADECGTGASGRNSGGMGHWWAKLPTLVRLFGVEDARFLLQASLDILDQIRDFVETNHIKCDLRRGLAAWSATARSQIGAWNPMFAAAKKIGLVPPYRTLSSEELRAKFGKGPYHAAIVEEGGTRVQPALLARGLRRLALGNGIEIFERSPVTQISGQADSVIVKTEVGQIVSKQVVLAANAWMAHLPPFRATTMVLSSDIIVTERIPELIKSCGIGDRPGGVNSRLMLNYGGYTPDGRVYLGRGAGSVALAAKIGPMFDYSARQAAEVEDDFRFLYPEFRQVPIARAWAGPIDRSTTGLPSFGRLSDKRIHFAIGFTGHGVAASAIAGRVLAGNILEKQDRWTDAGACLLRGKAGVFPPEPIRYVAARVVRASVVRKELADRKGRRPYAIDTYLSKLSNASLPEICGGLRNYNSKKPVAGSR
jgi:glycine/D-amino acid oxidase-like deaminating enzyme